MFNRASVLLQKESWLGKMGVQLVGMLLISSFIFSQQQTGKLTGKITDASSNEPLAGVSISVKGRQEGTASITDGTYILALSPGTYTIVYSSSSYKTKEITAVIIKAKETMFLDILMEKATQQLQGVVVSSNVRRESQSSVYSAQKRSAAASDGISQEAINKTPDNNAGQILKRVTGINVQDNRFVVVRGLGEQYNQTMLNGAPMTSTETDRNAFAFDLIPSAAIDNITVNKTATPDMPGNFAGGIVQVNTKDFPAADFFSVTVGGGFSDQTIGKQFFGDKKGKLEILAMPGDIRNLPKEFPTSNSRTPIYGYNIQEQYRFAKMLKNNLAPVNHGSSKPNENVQIGYGKTIKFSNNTQLGIVAALSQRKTEYREEEVTTRDPLLDITVTPGTINSGEIRQADYYAENVRYRYNADLGGVLNFAYRFGNNKITLKNLYTRILRNQYIDRQKLIIEDFNINGNEELRGISYIVNQKSIFNVILAGEHRTGNGNETRLDWNINATANNTITPDTRNFIVATDTATKVLRLNTNVESIQAALSGTSRLWSRSDDFIYGGAFNVTTPFNLFGNKHLLKGGILFQNRERKANGTVLPIIGAYANSVDSLLDPANFYPGRASIEIVNASVVGDPGNYLAGSSLLAIYESLENKFGNKLRVIWGLRVENYQQQVNVYRPYFFDNYQQPELLPRSFAARTTFNFLPSVNVIYSPVTAINIRAAVSSTVIRPELKDLVSFPSYDFQTFTLTSGNSLLRSTSIQNYDLKAEWFPSAGEIISFSVFYKNIINPIEYARATIQTSIRVPVNTGNAYVKGVEAEIRKKLDFIPGAPWLRQVTVFGNGTLLESKVEAAALDNFLVLSTNEHTLTGQSKYIVNAGVSVALFKNSFETTVSFNKAGDYINELGSSETIQLTNGNTIPFIPHYRMKARNMLDIVLTQSLFKNKCKLKFNIANVLDEPLIIYQDLNGNGKFDSPVIVETLKSPRGVYVSGIDNMASNSLGQRTYSFSIGYTF